MLPKPKYMTGLRVAIENMSTMRSDHISKLIKDGPKLFLNVNQFNSI